MAQRQIREVGDDLLRKKSREVEVIDEKIKQLLDDMYETMVINKGCGIAAPQVGILKRAVIVETNGQKLEMINPIITKATGCQTGSEGCLSVKNVRGEVDRPYKLTVEFVDRYGYPMTLTACDFLAVAICHELDHLDGILFIDKMIKEGK